MRTENFSETLRQMPKVELHCHVDGSVRPNTVVELARKNEVRLPSYDPNQIYPPGYDADGFFRTLFGVSNVIVTPDDYCRVLYEALSDAVAAGNVRYTEIFVQATMHPRMRYPELLAGLLDAVRSAKTDTGIRANLVPAINRGQGPSVARDLVEEVIAHRCDEVVGIGLDGDNFIGPAEQFAESFVLAERNGLRRTAHAGLPLEDTKVALDLLHCDRIDHGYLVVNDQDLLARVVEERVHFTACWTLASYYCPTDRDSSPIQKMVDAGMSVSINTDDPYIFHTDIGTEYVEAASTLGWDIETAWARVLDAIDATWLPEDERVELRHRLNDEMSALTSTT